MPDVLMHWLLLHEKLFLESYQKVQAAIDGMVKDGLPHATYFELLYAVAMVAFQKEKAEYVVLETGLGGRLDATNTIEHPIATVITSISLDHTEILGDTIEKIAGEKAGIIKEGVPKRQKRSSKRGPKNFTHRRLY